MRVAIVDDEALARRRVARLLAAHRDVELVAELGDAAEAEVVLPELAPDVVLLDVRMPRRDGFDVAAALGGTRCQIVFITAHDSHAVQAFEAGATDYLLKPVDDQRLARALDRARARLASVAPAARLADAVAALRPEATPARFAVRDGGRFLFVAIADVDAATAAGNYVELRAGGRTYSLRATLAAVEARLEPSAFVRIHRSVVVRTARISAIEPLFHGEYLVTLADGTTYTSARTHRAALRGALGLPP
jgi:two-component system LytT family response regulator